MGPIHTTIPTQETTQMSKSYLDRVIAAATRIGEDPTRTPKEQLKALDIARQSIKLKPKAKRPPARSKALKLLLAQHSPAKPAPAKPAPEES